MSKANAEVRFCVYKLAFPNGKLYFGISSDMKRRLRSHRHCEKSARSKRPIVHAIKKYGWDSVSVSVIFDNLDAESAYSIESKLIAENFTQDFAKGYNLASGGRTNNGYKHPNIWSKGIKLSSGHCKKLSEAKLMDSGLRERCSNNATRFPVEARNIVTGFREVFKNARDCADKLGLNASSVYQHIQRNSNLFRGQWQFRQI